MILIPWTVLCLVSLVASGQTYTMGHGTSPISNPADFTESVPHKETSVGRNGNVGEVIFHPLPPPAPPQKKRFRGMCAYCSPRKACSIDTLICMENYCVLEDKQVIFCKEGRIGHPIQYTRPLPNSPAFSEWCGPCGPNIAVCRPGQHCHSNHCLSRSIQAKNCTHSDTPCKPSVISQCASGTHCSPCGKDIVPCARGHSCVAERCVMQGFSRKSCDRELARVCEPCDSRRKCERKVCTNVSRKRRAPGRSGGDRRDRGGGRRRRRRRRHRRRGRGGRRKGRRRSRGKKGHRGKGGSSSRWVGKEGPKCGDLRCYAGFCALSGSMADKCRKKMLEGGSACGTNKKQELGGDSIGPASRFKNDDTEVLDRDQVEKGYDDDGVDDNSRDDIQSIESTNVLDSEGDRGDDRNIDVDEDDVGEFLE